METKDILTLIGVFITLIIGIANLFNGLLTNKRTLYVNSVTTERVKWIGQLKELLAEYVAMTSMYDQRVVLKDEELSKYIERLLYLRNRIKLHLNPTDERDKKIVDLIDKVNKKFILLYSYIEIKKMKTNTDEEKFKVFEEIMKLLGEEFVKHLEDKHQFFTTNKKKLHNNESSEEIYNLINDELDMLIKKEIGGGKEELIEWSEELISLSGSYLKEEWERVKLESQSGRPLSRKVEISKKKLEFMFFIISAYVITGFMLHIYIPSASRSSLLILLALVAYTSFFPFIRQVFKYLKFNEGVRIFLNVVIELSLLLTILAVIKVLFVFPENTKTEMYTYLWFALLYVLRYIFEFSSQLRQYLVKVYNSLR